MYDQKWTIRGIDDEAREVLEQIHLDYGIPYGRLINQALWEWIEGLDEEEPVPIIRPLRNAA